MSNLLTRTIFIFSNMKKKTRNHACEKSPLLVGSWQVRERKRGSYPYRLLSLQLSRNNLIGNACHAGYLPRYQLLPGELSSRKTYPESAILLFRMVVFINLHRDYSNSLTFPSIRYKLQYKLFIAYSLLPWCKLVTRNNLTFFKN